MVISMLLSWLREAHGTRCLAPLPSQVLTLGGHGSAEKDVVEEDVTEDIAEDVVEDIAELH